MSMVLTNNLFRVKEFTVVQPDVGGAVTLVPGMILWMHGSRKSSLGGYIGTFSFTYEQKYGLSPKPGKVFMMSTDHVEAAE